METVPSKYSEAPSLRIGHLSFRQRQISLLVSTGASNKEIAKELGISIKTVKNILTTVFDRTGTRSRTELAIRLVQAQYDTSRTLR